MGIEKGFCTWEGPAESCLVLDEDGTSSGVVLKQGEAGQGTTFKRIEKLEHKAKLIRTKQVRWWTSRLPLDIEPPYTLFVTWQQAKTHTHSAMTVPRLTTKVKKWAVAQILKIPIQSPKQLGYPSHSLAYEMTHSYKN